MNTRLLACASLALLVSSIVHCSSSSSSTAGDSGDQGGSGQEGSGESGQASSGRDSGSSGGGERSGNQGRSGNSGQNGTGGSGRSGQATDAGTSGARPTDGGRDANADTSASDAAKPDAPRGDSGPVGAKFVGNITTSGAVRDGFIRYWNQITPENEGKWGSVERVRGSRNWAPLDRIYKYAQDNKIPVKAHTFVWGSQQPDWLASLSPAEQSAAVQDWIKSYCTRYPDTKYIDVVNEPPPHTTPSYMNGIGGAGTSGWDWIVNSFKWARESCPNAILILNDYNNIEYGAEHAHFLDIVRAVQKAGAPIDAIGAQAHDAWRLPTATVKRYLDALAATGLPVYISEYDIGEANDERQRAIMEEQFTMFYEHPSVPGVTLWGYIVGSTWRDNTGIQHPNGTMRPAMTWLMKYLDRPTN